MHVQSTQPRVVRVLAATSCGGDRPRSMELQLSPAGRGDVARTNSPISVRVSHDEWLANLHHEMRDELDEQLSGPGEMPWRRQSMSSKDRQSVSPQSDYATPVGDREPASPTLYGGSPREVQAARASRVHRSPLADQARYRLDPQAGPKPRTSQQKLDQTPIGKALEDRDQALAVYLAMQTQAVASFANRWLRVDLAGPGTPARKAPPPLPAQLAQAERCGREHLMQRVQELEKRLTRAETDRCRQEAKTADFLLESAPRM